MTDSATFRATFPPIQSAIKIYGDETGMRIQLEIPESDMAQAVKLLTMRGKVLLVTVKPQEYERDESRKIHI